MNDYPSDQSGNDPNPDSDSLAAWDEYGIVLDINGHWYLNEGEITAPIYSQRLGRNLYPPWWPIYEDIEMSTTHDFSALGKSTPSDEPR